MKICIPIKEDNGLDSIAYNHFGSAPFYMIYNLGNQEIKVIENDDLHHVHGMCQPIKALNGEKVDAILVGGIGAGALKKLNDQDVKVYRVSEDTVSMNIELLKQNKLYEFSINDSCSSHNCSH